MRCASFLLDFLFKDFKTPRKAVITALRHHDIEPVVDQESADALEAAVNHPGRLTPENKELTSSPANLTVQIMRPNP